MTCVVWNMEYGVLKTSFVTTKPAEIAHVLVHASCMHLVSAQTVCSSLE